MKVIDLVQGSPEWLEARAGVPTASEFDRIINMDGKPSKQREKYLYQLAGERVTGKKEETYTNGAMARGVELEPEARQLYELVTGNQVAQTGICLLDNESCGCSPDGIIVGSEIGIEIKCPTIAVHVGYLLENKMPSDYFQQVHGSMFVTGFKYWEFLSYYPGLKPLLIRVERDEKFISALKTEMEKFCKELNEITERIRA